MNDIPTSKPTEFTEFGSDLPTLTTSERHRLLSAERRRATLRVLEERSLPIGLDVLADAVLERERGVDSPGPASAEAVRITLHHKHLPLMTDLGVIDFDPDAQQVRAP